MSGPQYIRHSESPIHPVLRVLWQLDLETRISGVQRRRVSQGRVKGSGQRVHVIDLCGRREVDSLQRDKDKFIVISSKYKP